MSEDAKIDQATQEAIAEHTDTVAHQPAQEATAECADAMVQQSVEQDSGEGRKTAQAEAPSAQEPAADSGGEADVPKPGSARAASTISVMWPHWRAKLAPRLPKPRRALRVQ